MPLADSGETLVLDALLTGRFVSLHTAIPPTSEIVGGNYARQSADFAKVSGPDPTVYKNNGVIQYSTATADWGLITHFGIWTALNGGSLLAYNIVGVPKLITSGDIIRWDLNMLTVDVT